MNRYGEALSNQRSPQFAIGPALILLILTLFHSPGVLSGSSIIYVDADAAGADNGTSWSNA
ncbi:MAG: hypothetical protein AAGJ52_11005, partial [Pseudomonadota bacterium]